MQCGNTIATVSSGSCVGIIAALGIGFTIPIITITSSNRLFFIYGFIDGQMQCGYTITAVGSGGGVWVVSASSVCLTIPSVAIASGYYFFFICGFVDGQMEYKYAIATADTCCCVFISARFTNGYVFT